MAEFEGTIVNVTGRPIIRRRPGNPMPNALDSRFEDAASRRSIRTSLLD